MKEKSCPEVFNKDCKQSSRLFNSSVISSIPSRSPEIIPMAATQHDSRQSSATSRQERVRFAERLTKKQQMSGNMRRYSRDRFNFSLLKDTGNIQVPGSEALTSSTDENDRASSSRTDMSWRPCCGKAYHAPDMVNNRKSQSAIYPRELHHKQSASFITGPTVAGGLLHNKRAQLLNCIRIRNPSDSGTTIYSHALSRVAFADVIQQRLVRSNSEFRVMTPHVASQYRDMLFIPIHAGERMCWTSEQNLPSTDRVHSSNNKKQLDVTCAETPTRFVKNLDATCVDTSAQFLKRHKTQMNVLISYLPSESSISEKSLDNVNVSINKLPQSRDTHSKQMAGTQNEKQRIFETEGTTKSPPLVSNENQKKAIDRAPNCSTLAKGSSGSQGVTKSGSSSEKDRRGSRRSSISSVSAPRSRRNSVLLKSHRRLSVIPKVTFPVPDCWVDDATVSSLQSHEEHEEENVDNIDTPDQQNNNNKHTLQSKRVHIMEAETQLNTETFEKTCNIREEYEKRVVHLSQLPDRGLRLPDFICPSSETKSREVAIKQWLISTNFSCANKHVPLI